ncbi:MAG TPA: hypothetical protein VMK65_00985 [Longimicrobiales bacterium]|nr:hypothetical protein [Longimicrobiales bacterium]
MLTLQLAAFVFFTIGIKVILGVLACWLLLPTERCCPACDGASVSVEPAWGAAWLSRVTRVRRRWCLRCTRTFWVRGLPEPLRVRVRAPEPEELEGAPHRA